eukprot:TRINITY_DN6377_c0_g1_i1.p2 TRINITY_DN6377_c0_g1~~TRINITY_DN6377_c0_g1_i1.p2  ORF type:complete len:165 (+),score=26.14 TRINITY_DN6377_c0_g1_i1:1054-1548(+)
MVQRSPTMLTQNNDVLMDKFRYVNSLVLPGSAPYRHMLLRNPKIWQAALDSTIIPCVKFLEKTFGRERALDLIDRFPGILQLKEKNITNKIDIFTQNTTKSIALQAVMITPYWLEKSTERVKHASTLWAQSKRGKRALKYATQNADVGAVVIPPNKRGKRRSLA